MGKNKDEIKVDEDELRNSVNILRNISGELAELNSVTCAFEESKGYSKNALSDELDAILEVGFSLKDALDKYADYLDNVADVFEETDSKLGDLFKQKFSPYTMFENKISNKTKLFLYKHLGDKSW